MPSTIPEFNKKLQPLTSLLEDVLELARSRKETKAAKIKLKGSLWTAQYQQESDALKNLLMHSVTIAHMNPEKILGLFTDASEAH